MYMKKLLTIALGTFLVAGCVPSWNALYTDKDLIFDPQLVGTWKDEHNKESWVFEKSGEKQYKLAYTDENGRKATFDAHLLKVKDRRFLDLFLTEASEKDLEVNALAMVTLLPAHLFLRVDEVGPALKMAAVNPDWLEKHLEKNPGAVAHRKIGKERVVFTAEPRDLQAFVMKHVEGEELFGGPFTLALEASKPSK